MRTSVEHIDAATVRMTVTVLAEDVDAAIDAAYKRIAGKVRIPGFRAGKAPRPIIDTHVGREAVVADAQEELLGESYTKALDAEKLRPLAQPEIDELDAMEAGAEFEFVAKIEVRPDLTLSSVENLAITVPPATASEHEINAQIDTMREQYASLEPVEDRGVGTDDFVLISFIGRLDGEEYEGNTVDKYLYEMRKGLMPTEFDDGLVGVEAGGETHIEFKVPDTSTDPEYAGKTVSFEVTVHEIKAKVLPEIDEEFATSVGGFDSVDELRKSVREQLDPAKQDAHTRAIEDKARGALAERLEGTVPEAMVEGVKSQMLRDFASSLEQRSISLDEYLNTFQMSLEQFQEDTAKFAAARAREELALEALFRQLEFTITDEDIEQEIVAMSAGTDQTVAELRATWEESGAIAVLGEQLTHKKALVWLLDAVEITEEEPHDDANNTDAEKE